MSFVFMNMPGSFSRFVDSKRHSGFGRRYLTSFFFAAPGRNSNPLMACISTVWLSIRVTESTRFKPTSIFLFINIAG